MADDLRTTTDADQHDGDRHREHTGTGVSKWSILALVLGILLAVILGQNTDSVDVQVLWTEFSAPLFLIVALAALGLTVVWELVTLVFRHRRRRAARS
ncbi:MAG: hypothetical protein ACSLFP_04670 [Acidimicrobiales bacterium]